MTPFMCAVWRQASIDMLLPEPLDAALDIGYRIHRSRNPMRILSKA
jgi:hypothetical protein